MESLVPSEIARLVYGYLIEEDCEAAAQLFLQTSSSLKECLLLQKKGRKFNTTVLGLSLVDILNLYTDAVCLVKNYLAREESLNHALSEFVKELGNVLVIDHDSGRNISKTVFLRISVPNKKKARRNSVHLESIEEEEEEEEKTEKEKESQPIEQEKITTNEESVPAKNNTNSSNDEFDLNILQTLIDNTALHERLAENINKAIDSSGETSNHKTDEKKIIETILHNTEADPIFHELLDGLVAPLTEETTTPEDTDKENGDPAEERQAPNVDSGHPTSEDPETSKKIEEESNLAIEGILAGNKKMQEEKVNEEPQPTETIVISTPQAIATSSGIYKQSFIIPAGYTVTDVFPASQMSTPLQPINTANLATFGHLSPILPHSGGITKQSVSICSLQPRRRRILPKTDSFYIQIPTQDDQVQEVKVEIPTAPKRIPEGIKGSRVRTRGGIQKVGTRGVKALVPQVSKPVDSNIRLIVSPNTLKKSNTSGIKTRAMLKKQEKDIVKPSVTEVTQPISDEEPQEVELPTEKDSLPEKNKENPDKPQEDCVNDVTEATPQQQTIPKQPRMSLSTPRRTHVRALDFETPEKHLTLRKSMTSPKVYHHQKKEPRALEFIKRGGMFSSPPKEMPKADEKPEVSKSKKGWDSDLRNFMASKENLDIPTSVGLKRKPGAKREKSTNAKRKVTRKKVNKKPPVKKNSNEELVDQIEKEVRDVIGEEEMALNTSQNSELGNLIEQKLMEEMNKNDSSSSLEIIADEKQQNAASKSPDTTEETTNSKEIMEGVVSKDDMQKNPEPQVSNNEDCTNDTDKHDAVLKEFNTSTPLKLAMSPVNENSRGQLTPTTKLVMSHLGKVNTRYPSVFSPTSQSSLENILIKECSRMETEKNISNLAQDIEKLSSPKSDNCSNNPSGNKAAESKKDTSNFGDKELTFESVCKNSVNLFQTPAKFMSAPIPPGTPVEMTPLTKVLVSETSFANTMLVTPTLPPTPKHSSLETPQKTDESSVNSINLSGKESDRPQQDIVISPSTNQDKSVNQDNLKNHPLETDIHVNNPPALIIDHSKNTNNDHVVKNKDTNETAKNIDAKTTLSPGVEKQFCATPKIKLMSPKLSKCNESSVKKKSCKIVEQHKSSEGNASKLTQVISKLHAGSSFDGRDSEHVIDLESSNPSELSDNNKSSERIEGKTNKKQAPREIKKQTSRKKTCLERNNKSLKKPPKQNIAKPSNKLLVDEEMESEIRHLLKGTKAKLFGPDNSSDSDSSMNNDLELKQSNVQIKTARERLQKLESISMLNSSSTSDESSDNETIVKPKISQKNLKDGLSFNNSEHSNDEDSLECNSVVMKHSESLITKKADGGSNSKVIESSTKAITKEIEESCESFPTLHLSEESNQSLKLDNHLNKFQKSRKSPLSGNDLAGKKSSLLPLTTSSPRANEQTAVEKTKATKDPRKICNTTSSKKEVQTNLNIKTKNDHESHTNERVFHIYSETVKSKFSDSEEKLNLARSQSISKYLDSYVYSFTLDVDKSGNYLNKELRSGPFLHIFDLAETQSLSPHIRKDERKIGNPRTDQRIRPRSRSRNRKRNRSASSEDEKEKRDYNRSYASYRGGNIQERDRERAYRYRSHYDRRDSFLRKKYRDMRSHHDSRYRDYDHYSPYNKKRSRHNSPEPRRNSKKEDRRPLEEKMQSSSKYKMYSNVNDSFTSSKSGSEGDGKHTDMNCTYSSEISLELQKERCSTSSQRLVVDDQPSYSRRQSQSRTSERSLGAVREDGELSDSSEVKRISPGGGKSAVLTLGAHDSRAKLLNKVDLDQFLSIVHGEED